MASSLRRHIMMQQGGGMEYIFGVGLTQDVNSSVTIFSRTSDESCQIHAYAPLAEYWGNILAIDSPFSYVQISAANTLNTFLGINNVQAGSVYLLNRQSGENVVKIHSGGIDVNGRTWSGTIPSGGNFYIAHNGGYSSGRGESCVYTKIIIGHDEVNEEVFLPVDFGNGEIGFMSNLGNIISHSSFIRIDSV